METAVEDRVEEQEETLSLGASTALPRRISLIEKYKAEIKIAKETLKSALDDSPEYEAATVEAKAAMQKKKQIKDQLWASNDYQAQLWKIKENQEEIAALEEILTAELMQLYQTKNIDEVADENGEPRKFKVTVKLLPKMANKSPFDAPDQNPGMILG
ncbi:MAG: hypothetical protein AAB701_00400 [Patescibacteria group bacterium]